MPRDVGLYLEDMLEAARRLERYLDGLAHSNFEVDLDIVWDAATNKVPGLVGALRRLLADPAG